VQNFSKNSPEPSKKVKVSAISVNDTIYGYNDEIMNKLFEESENSAKNGAKIISWAEANGLITEENLQRYLQKSSQIAKKYELYFFPTFWIKSPNNLTKNQVFGFNSKGEQILEYNKNEPLPNEKIFRGDGKIPVVNTNYDRIAVAICFDNDHPELIAGSGKNQADILLSPSRDWKQINPKHSYIVSFRSIENGLTTIKSTNFGDSVIWDNKGKVIAQNKFSFENYQVRVLEATIDVQRKQTLYSKIGDLVVWLSFCLIIVFIILKLFPFSVNF
jgi:apolipoprotein N-acyltransferase